MTSSLPCRIDKNETNDLHKGHDSKDWKMPILMMHYARTLEKYELKSKTWKTASGEQAKADKYKLEGFMDRQLGQWTFLVVVCSSGHIVY